jgi:HD-like signal output (HDOD) protein
MFWKKITERAAFATGDFTKIFANLEIPPLPQLALQIMKIAQGEDFDVQELGRLIASDTGMTAKVLRLVNSSAFGLRHRVTEVEQGIVLLGPKRIQALVMGLATAESLPANAEGFDRLAFWQDSLQRAVFAQSVAAAIARGTEGEAFTGSLLQNMAQPILLSRWSDHYLPITQLARESDKPLIEIEDQQLTWNHAQAGAWMARNWGFLDVLTCCVGLHHASVQQLISLDLLRTPVAAVAASSQLPDASSFCSDALEISADGYRSLCEATDVDCEQIAQLFEVPQPEPLAPRLKP